MTEMILSWAKLIAASSFLQQDVSDALRAVREKHDVPGLVALAAEGARVVARGASGVRRRGSDAAIAVTDPVHIGSCTKSMTATLAAMLVADKKLAWTSAVGEVFDDMREMHEDWKGVTLTHLLTHRGGAPADLAADGLWARLRAHEGTPFEARRALVEGVLRRPPEARLGTAFIYSNAGYAIAGAMAEKVTGRAWEDLLRERLFEPLGMASAGFGAPGTKETLDQPRGHTAAGKPVEPGPEADNPAAIRPAGGVHTSLGDWAKYAAQHARHHRDGSRRPLGVSLKSLQPAAFEVLQAPAGEGEPRYAMGWAVAERTWAGGPVLTHGGSNTMWFAVAWVVPKKDFVLLAAVNQGGDRAEKACDEAVTAMLRALKLIR